MKKWGQPISLIIATLLFIGAASYVSHVSKLALFMTSEQVDYLNEIKAADRLYFLSQALWMLVVLVNAVIASRATKNLVLICTLKCLSWFAASNLFDELFSRNPQLSSPQEYWWAGVAVVDCVLEYHGSTIPKFLLVVIQKILSYLNITWTLKRKKWPRRTG